MLREAIDTLTSLARESQQEKLRPIFTTPNDGSKRLFMWDDTGHQYTELDRYVQRGGTPVATLRSFVDLVLAEAPRFDDKSGALGTVCFNSAGAWYKPDYRDDRIKDFTYTRAISKAWSALIDLTKGSMYDQVAFVRALQGLRPWLQDGAAVLRSYRSIDFTKKVAFRGQPIVENGKAGRELSVDVTLASGKTDKASFPTTLAFRLPFTNDSQPVDVSIETDVVLDEDAGKLFFTAAWPELQAAAAAAQEEEYRLFVDTVKAPGKLPELVVLRNF